MILSFKKKSGKACRIEMDLADTASSKFIALIVRHGEIAFSEFLRSL